MSFGVVSFTKARLLCEKSSQSYDIIHTYIQLLDDIFNAVCGIKLWKVDGILDEIRELLFVAVSDGTFEGTGGGKLEGPTYIDDQSKYNVYDIQLCTANGILDDIREFFIVGNSTGTFEGTYNGKLVEATLIDSLNVINTL